MLPERERTRADERSCLVAGPIKALAGHRRMSDGERGRPVLSSRKVPPVSQATTDRLWGAFDIRHAVAATCLAICVRFLVEMAKLA